MMLQKTVEADADFADEMQFCLLCRHCESVCPAGVNFGAMMEHTRGALRQSGRLGARERILRWLGFRLVLPRRWAVELAAMGLRLLQSLKLTRLVRLLGAHDDGLPLVPPRAERRPLPASIPASGERRPRGGPPAPAHSCSRAASCRRSSAQRTARRPRS